MNHCAACAFVYDDVTLTDIAPRLADLGRRYRIAASEAPNDDALRRRPDDATWSALEYLCHVRDVLRVQRERLLLAIETDQPEFVSMDRDARPARDRYNAQDPLVVLAELDAAARQLADSFAALTPEQWDRTGVYNWPERATRSMAWIGRHTIHEGEHHLRDIKRELGPPMTRNP